MNKLTWWLLLGAVLVALLYAPWCFASASLDVAMHYFPGRWKVADWVAACMSVGLTCAIMALAMVSMTSWHWSVKAALAMMIAGVTLRLALRILLEYESCGDIPEFIHMRAEVPPRSLTCS